MGLRVSPLLLPDIYLLEPKRFEDTRGFFSEVWNQSALEQHGIDVAFVQDNHSYSAEKFTLRGLHYQAAPDAQDKLIRCTRGKILDVAVDVRQDSPHFGKWVCAHLSAENWKQLFVPKGFAHGFLTLTDHCEVLYKTSDYYAKDSEVCIAWNDPDIGVEWGLEGAAPILSDKDKVGVRLSSIKDTGF